MRFFANSTHPRAQRRRSFLLLKASGEPPEGRFVDFDEEREVVFKIGGRRYHLNSYTDEEWDNFRDESEATLPKFIPSNNGKEVKKFKGGAELQGMTPFKEQFGEACTVFAIVAQHEYNRSSKTLCEEYLYKKTGAHAIHVSDGVSKLEEIGTCFEDLFDRYKRNPNNIHVISDARKKTCYEKYRVKLGDEVLKGLRMMIDKGYAITVELQVSGVWNREHGEVVRKVDAQEVPATRDARSRTHSICMCGYDTTYKFKCSSTATGAFKFKNSWKSFGKDGFGWMSDFYIIGARPVAWIFKSY